ncbi:hypothetical protein [Streptomyces sp. NPDC049879]
MPRPLPRYLTVAPVREENPKITIITGLEGPVLPRPEPDSDEPEGGEGE